MVASTFEYIGNLLPEDQEKLIDLAAKRFFRGNERQRRQQALEAVIPFLEERSFGSFAEAYITFSTGRGSRFEHYQ